MNWLTSARHWDWLFDRTQDRQPARSLAARLFRPQLELLEDRIAPSVTAVDDAYYPEFGVGLIGADNVLFNDSGSSLTASLLSQASHGTVTLYSDGSVEYEQTDLEFVGQDSFTYQASDGVDADSATAYIHIARAETTIALMGFPSPVFQGEMVELSVSVTTSPYADTEGVVVTYKDGSTVIGTAELDEYGDAVLQTTQLALGTRTITAELATQGVFEGSTSNSAEIVVNANTAPTLDAIDDQVGTEGDSVNLQTVGDDVDEQELTFSATGLPAGVDINTSTGLISGTLAFTAGETNDGIYDVEVTVEDTSGATASRTFQWTVYSVLAPIADQTWEIDGEVYQPAEYGNPEWNTRLGDLVGLYEFSATGLPSGVSIDSETGLLSGTPDTYSTGTATITVDTGNGEDSVSFDWVIVCTPVVNMPGQQWSNLNAALELSTTNVNAISVESGYGTDTELQIEMAMSGGTATLAQTTGLSFVLGDGTADSLLSFTGSLADINSALDGMTFTPTTGFHDEAIIMIVAMDLEHFGAWGQALMAFGEVSVAVGGPVVHMPETQTTNVDIPLMFASLYGNGITIDDPPVGAQGVQVELTIDNGTVTLSTTSGLTFLVGDGTADDTLRFTGSVEAVNAALEGMVFTPSSEFVGIAAIDVVATDLGTGWASGSDSGADSTQIEVLDADVALAVISQVYASGGTEDAVYYRDYVELFNRGDSPINLSGRSLQYADPESGTWEVIELAGIIAPGHFYLIAGASGGIDGEPLPTPDLDTELALRTEGGKVALVNGNTPLSGELPASASIIDLVGYGDADHYEGADPAPAIDESSAVFRAHDGYADTNENGVDLYARIPEPRNAEVSYYNGAPENVLPWPQKAAVNDDLVFSSAAGNLLRIFDAEAWYGDVQVTLAASNGTVTLFSTTGLSFLNGDGTADVSMTLFGSLADINAALDGMIFTPTTDFVGDTTITVQANDRNVLLGGGAQADADHIIVSVLPVVTIEAGDSINEAGTTSGIFTLTRTGDATGALTVAYRLGGTAINGVDYEALSGVVEFAAEQSTTTVVIVPIDDDVLEDDTVILAIAEWIDYFPGTTVIAELQILDESSDCAAAAPTLELDVNADKDIVDDIDKAENYLPGYEGNTPKLSSGAFNAHTYTGQKMMLIVEGIGAETANLNEVKFTIVSVSQLPGYASNMTDAKVTGETKNDDYSFTELSNKREMTVVAATTEAQGGKIEAKRTWVEFWAKDYGGWAKVKVEVKINNQIAHTLYLSVPIDSETVDGVQNVGDGIADKYEEKMLKAWKAQYNLETFNTTDLDFFKPTDDLELEDPDGAGTAHVGQAEKGDGHTVLEEYRGYILDGGGFDGAGKNNHTGGHVRLSFARKEILAEVDRMKQLTNLPEAGLAAMLDGASKVFSNEERAGANGPARGAGIYMYYVLDETELQLSIAQATTDSSATMKAHRDSKLKSDFIHLLFCDTMPDTTAFTKDEAEQDPDKRGCHFFIASFKRKMDRQPANLPAELRLTKLDENIMTVIVHEIVHLLVVNPEQDGTNWVPKTGEHTGDANGDGKQDSNDWPCVMRGQLMVANRELATVQFFDIVKRLLRTRTTGGINP